MFEKSVSYVLTDVVLYTSFFFLIDKSNNKKTVQFYNTMMMSFVTHFMQTLSLYLNMQMWFCQYLEFKFEASNNEVVLQYCIYINL